MMSHPGSLYLSFQGTIRVGLAATSICEDAHTVLQSYCHSTVTLHCVLCSEYIQTVVRHSDE